MSETQRTTNCIASMLTKLGSTADAVDVSIQSSTNALFQYLLMHNIKSGITLTEEALKDTEVINVSAGHGFTAVSGEYMTIRYGDAFEQTKVISVATNAITVEMPIAITFPVAGTIITRGNVNMNIDGVTTPTTFELSLNSLTGAITPIDVSTVIVTMQHGSNVPDDGQFGGLTALTKGMYFRKLNGETTNLGNYTTNQEFIRVGASVEYSDKAPAGTNGTNIVFRIEEIFGQVIRLDPRTDDRLMAHVRDDIDATAGMAGMTVAIIGSFTSGE